MSGKKCKVHTTSRRKYLSHAPFTPDFSERFSLRSIFQISKVESYWGSPVFMFYANVGRKRYFLIISSKNQSFDHRSKI